MSFPWLFELFWLLNAGFSFIGNWRTYKETPRYRMVRDVFHLINNVDNQNAVSSLWREKLVNFAGLLKVILTHMLCKWDCLMSGEGSLSCLCPPMFYSMFLFKFFTVFLPDIRFMVLRFVLGSFAGFPSLFTCLITKLIVWK